MRSNIKIKTFTNHGLSWKLLVGYTIDFYTWLEKDLSDDEIKKYKSERGGSIFVKSHAGKHPKTKQAYLYINTFAYNKWGMDYLIKESLRLISKSVPH